MKHAWIFAVCFLLLAQYSSYAQIDVRGSVDTYHAMRVKEPQDYLASRTKVRMEMDAENDDTNIFASFNAIKNYVVPSQSGIELHEAYIQYAADSWDLRAGRQLIIWGKADGISITDVISPMDYTEFLAQDYDDIRMPVDAAKFRYLRDQMNVELIWIPIFQPAILPPADSPWAFGAELPEGIEILHEPSMVPEKKLKNSEFGGKISFYFPWGDLALSSFYTWNKVPVMNQTLIQFEDVDGARLTIKPEHYRLTFAGFEFSIPYNAFVFRSESAFFKGQYFEPQELSDGLFEKNSINWLLGVDWYPGSEWTLSAQFADFFVLDYDQKIADDEHEMLITLNISKNLFRNTLTLSTSGYIGLNESEIFNRSSVDYELSDGLHLEAGLDIFAGDGGSFGQYKDNSEVWIKAKYSF